MQRQIREIKLKKDDVIIKDDPYYDNVIAPEIEREKLQEWEKKQADAD